MTLLNEAETDVNPQKDQKNLTFLLIPHLLTTEL